MYIYIYVRIVMYYVYTRISIYMYIYRHTHMEGYSFFLLLLACGFWLLRLLPCGFWLHFAMEGIFFLDLSLFISQSGAASLAICCTLEPTYLICALERKSPICMSTWLLPFGFWLYLNLALSFWFCWLFGFCFTWPLAFGFWPHFC